VVWPQNHWDDFSGLASKQVAMISPGLASKPVVGFLVDPQNQGGRGFLGLSFKTGNYGLMIYASKSQQRFLGLILKTKWVMVCRLHLQTDGRMRWLETRIEI
jgi:hypothetical protein